MNDGPVLELDGDSLILALHKEPTQVKTWLAAHRVRGALVENVFSA